MQKISPFLWFDKEAVKAAQFYISAFPGSKIHQTTVLENTPSGTVEVVSLELLGHSFTLMAAGPRFKFTPAISFMAVCNSREEVDSLWEKLSAGGSALMPLDRYPFSERYGWVQDKHGVSWQVILMGEHQPAQRIVPTLLFAGALAGKAEEAIRFYASVYRDSSVGDIVRYAKGEEPDHEGTVKHAMFRIEGQDFAAMDSARAHDFTFNEAISLEVLCENQKEIDHYWGKLSADEKAEQCGWLKDRYGISWQIVPRVLNKMLSDKDPKKVERVTQAFLKMKKFDIAALQRAYES